MQFELIRDTPPSTTRIHEITETDTGRLLIRCFPSVLFAGHVVHPSATRPRVPPSGRALTCGLHINDQQSVVPDVLIRGATKVFMKAQPPGLGNGRLAILRGEHNVIIQAQIGGWHGVPLTIVAGIPPGCDFLLMSFPVVSLRSTTG